MIAALVLSHLAVLLLGLAAGRLAKRHRWIELGREAKRQNHGWESSHYLQPAVPRPRRWSQRNVKREPATAEAAPRRPVFYDS